MLGSQVEAQVGFTRRDGYAAGLGVLHIRVAAVEHGVHILLVVGVVCGILGGRARGKEGGGRVYAVEGRVGRVRR